MTPDGKLFFETALAVGAVCLGLGIFIRRKETAPRKWPQLPGTIVCSTTQRQQIKPGQYQVVPLIEYEFEHQGKVVRSSHWRIGNFSTGNADAAAAILSRYNPGSPVTVYVNRQDPAKSVIEHSTTPLSWIPLGLGFGLILLALLPLF